jgi:uroporphyrinogen decarboxylase
MGIDAVNSQLFCMDMENVGKKHKGKITFWGEIDRQHILPFGTKVQVADAVNRAKEAVWMPQGGVIAQCEFGLKDPVENIETVFETWQSIV